MKKIDVIKWMTEYVIKELHEGREITIELKNNVVITPFPNCVTALFGTRELLGAFDKAMNKAIDGFHAQGKKVYECKVCGPDYVSIVYFTNPQNIEEEFKQVKNTIGIPSNLICISNTPDIKLN